MASKDLHGIGAGEKNQQVSLAQVVQHEDHLPVDMEEGEEREHHLAARL